MGAATFALQGVNALHLAVLSVVARWADETEVVTAP
jgi:hypothetical protein